MNPAPPGERLLTREFLLVGSTTLAFFVYTGVLIPLIPNLIEHRLGGSRFDIGLTLACFSAAAILSRPLLAALGERVGMRRTMIAGSLLALVATIGSIWVEHRYALLPLRALQGVGEAFVFVGGATIASAAAAPSRRAEAASYYSIGVFVGIGVGPLLADRWVNAGRFRDTYLLGAAVLAVGALLAAAIPKGYASPQRAQPGGPRFERAALLPGIALAVGIAAFVPFSAYMPAHARAVGFSGAGIAFGLYSAVCLAVRLLGAKLPERLGLERCVMLSMIGIAAGMAVLAGFPTRAGVVAGTLVVGLGVSLFYPALAGLAAHSVSAERQVRLMASFTMFFEIGSIVGALVFGQVANLTSRRGAFAGAAVMALVGLVFARTQLAPRWHAEQVGAVALGEREREAANEAAAHPTV